MAERRYPRMLAVAAAAAFAIAGPASALELTRGVNTFPWLYRTDSAASPDKPEAFYPYISQFKAEAFKSLREAGADFIRVPVDPTPLLDADPDRRAAIVAIILSELKKVTQTGMSAILDVAPREANSSWSATEILKSPDRLAAYQAILVDFAKAITDGKMTGVVLEPMNEPPGGWSWRDPVDWPAAQDQLVAAIRAVAPKIPLILTGDKGGSLEGLDNLKIQKDENPLNFYSFHYYEPMVVTHQGASWTSREWRRFMKNVPYPPANVDEDQAIGNFQTRVRGSDLSPDAKTETIAEGTAALKAYFEGDYGASRIADDFKKVSDWAAKRKIAPSRILLGEFGALRPGASLETLVNYTRDIRQAAEKAGFGWAYFNYAPHADPNGGFDVLRMTGSQKDDWDSLVIETGLGWKMPCGAQAAAKCDAP